MRVDRETRIHIAILLGVCLVGLSLRLWGAGHGLPNAYNPDEHYEVYRALRLGMGQFDLDRVTKGGYFYLLFVEFGIYYAALSLLGKVESSQEFARAIVADPSGVWWIGRITTAVIGAVNLLVVYRIGVRIGSAWVGIVAASVMSVAYVHVVHSHFITVDVPMTCLATLALLLAIRILQNGTPGEYVKAGVATGLAAITKLPAVLLVVPVLLAHGLRIGSWRQIRRLFELRYVALFAGTLAVVYVVGNPGILWKFGDLARGVFGQFAGEGWASHDLPLDMREGRNTWLFYGRALVAGVGWPVLTFAGIGAVASAAARRRDLMTLSVFVLAFYLVLSMSRDPNLIYDRYVLPMVPPLTVLAAYAIVGLASRATGSRAWRSIVIGAAACLLIFPNLLSAIRYDIVHSRKDTRTLAQEWIESNVPPGTRVFMRGNPEVKSALPVQLESTVENLIAMAKANDDDNPGKARYLRMRAKLARQPAYDVVTSRQTEPWPSWKECRESGVELVIMRHGPPSDSAPLPEARIPRSRALFDRDLNADPAVRLGASFDPMTLRSPGPRIRIYRVLSDTSD